MANMERNILEPKTQKGKMMKDKLKKAAAEIYGEKGYINTRIVDITTEADVSEGNFYRYYANKDEILVEIIEDMIDDIYEESMNEAKSQSSQKIKSSTRAFFKSIKKHAKLYNVFVQVSGFDPFYKEKQQELRKRFLKNVRRTFEKQQISTDIDLDYISSAIASMIQQTAYNWCVLGGEKEYNLEELSDTVSNIWINAIESTKKNSN